MTAAWPEALDAADLDPQWIDLEDLLPYRLCRRLPWWQAWCGTKPLDAPEEDLPHPWPRLPPGWPGSPRGWARAAVAAEAPWHLHGRADWLLEVEGRPVLVALGPPTPSIRLRLRLLAALLVLRGNPPPRTFHQPWPSSGPVELWTAPWPRVRPLGLAPFPLPLLAQLAAHIREDLESPLPPPRSAPPHRCWDCPAFPRCAELPA